MWRARCYSYSIWFKLVVIAAVILGFAQLVSANPMLLTPPHCDDTGCASTKPTDFIIKLPWDDSTTHTIIQGYGSGLHQGVCRTSAANDHHALDFDLTTGNSVRAVADGQVVYAGWATGGWSSYGQIVIIDHQNGYQSLYAHLNSLSVSDNQWVQQKQKIGEAGGTGGWTPHLHFSLYHNASIMDPGGPYGGCATVPEYFRGIQDYENLAQGMDLRSEDSGSDCPQSGGVILYKHANYDCGGEGEGSGYVLRSNTGWQNVPGSFNDQASSLRVPSGWSVRLYEHSDRGGASVCRNSDDPDFAGDSYDGGGGLNDSISSFEVFDNPDCGSGPPP
ncbi:MAG: hypothetical protein DRI80_05935, partial [Chloroflexota bacterium]